MSDMVDSYESDAYDTLEDDMEEVVCNSHICPTVEDFARFCLECGAKQDTTLVTLDEGEECAVEIEMVDGKIVICASPLSSKNVGSLVGVRLALLIALIGNTPPDTQDWAHIRVLANQILST